MKKWLGLIEPTIISLSTFLFMYFLQFRRQMSGFSGEDSFYHVGVAKLIAEKGVLTKFPYLYFTTLHGKFVDQHLLFHLLLIPFIKIFGEFAGPKIFICLLFALTSLIIFFILKYFKVKYALLVTLSIIVTLPSDFYFRMAFIRVQAAALPVILLAYYFIVRGKYIPLAILSFLFVWLYGGSLFLPVLIACFLFAQLISGEKLSLKTIYYGLGGFVAGLIINPYFPSNIGYYYAQIFQTGLGAKSYSGGEWRPYDTWYWVSISAIPAMVFSIGLISTYSKSFKKDSKVLALLIFTFFMLLLQLKSKRFVEYWPLFGSLVGLLMIKDLLKTLPNFFQRRLPLMKTIGIAIIVALSATAIVFKAHIEISRAFNDTATPINLDRTKQAMEYLQANSKPNDIVFTDDWDVFPFYFFYNRKDNYIVGLDPEFMNQYNHTLYEKYARISSGKSTAEINEIKTTFKSKWVIVGSDHQQFKLNLENKSDYFQLAYKNSDYSIFKVK